MDDDDAAPRHLDIGVEDPERDPPAAPKVDDPEGYYACQGEPFMLHWEVGSEA